MRVESITESRIVQYRLIGRSGPVVRMINYKTLNCHRRPTQTAQSYVFIWHA
jgi:hypothetical protein